MLNFLAQLPVSVLEMMAATLLIGAIGIVIIVFTALVSEVACRRIIRLVNAFAKLTNKDFRAVKHRRNEHSK